LLALPWLLLLLPLLLLLLLLPLLLLLLLVIVASLISGSIITPTKRSPRSLRNSVGRSVAALGLGPRRGRVHRRCGCVCRRLKQEGNRMRVEQLISNLFR
jgi:hypothetical protein